MSGWIGVDLDGTLAYYDRFKADELGPPIMPMVERVKGWLDEGWEVRIFTARVSGDGVGGRDVSRYVQMIEAWCLEHLGAILPVTCCKDYGMVELYDDRCVQVENNTGRLIGSSTRQL